MLCQHGVLGVWDSVLCIWDVIFCICEVLIVIIILIDMFKSTRWAQNPHHHSHLSPFLCEPLICQGPQGGRAHNGIYFRKIIAWKVILGLDHNGIYFWKIIAWKSILGRAHNGIYFRKIIALKSISLKHIVLRPSDIIYCWDTWWNRLLGPKNGFKMTVEVILMPPNPEKT